MILGSASDASEKLQHAGGSREKDEPLHHALSRTFAYLCSVQKGRLQPPNLARLMRTQSPKEPAKSLLDKRSPPLKLHLER